MLETLSLQLKHANSVVLSTHRNSDGDGLGAELALLLGLRQLGKKAWIVNPDAPPKKYAFLGLTEIIDVFGHAPVPRADLALILDTNDRRLVEPLATELEAACAQLLFIDHHPILKKGPVPSGGSVIDISAASTGEIVYRLLRELGVSMTAEIARALYTSVVFDTQMFRYVKADPRSHEMAAELLRFEREPELIHRHLFATYTVAKMSFMATSLSSVQYAADGHVALLDVNTADARASGLEPEESGDIIDLVMNIESVEVSALLREDAPGVFKLSLRSKGRLPVLPIAESFGGGGHMFASGAYLRGDKIELRERLLQALIELVTAPIKKAQ